MKISVVIPAYNVEEYIERAIDSVLAQTRTPDEIIVVDDGSSDATAEKIKTYGEKVCYIHQENRGLSGARNTGIRRASSEWIAFLDGDDEWLPRKLELQSELLKRNPQLSWIGGNFNNADCGSDRQPFPKLNGSHQAEARKKTINGDVFEDYFIAYRVMAAGHPDTMMIRKDVLLRVGLFCEELVMFEDLDMWYRLAYQDIKYGFVFEPVAIYYLNVPQSLTLKHKEFRFVDEYMQRHLHLARQAGKLTEFKQCCQGSLTFRVRFWMSYHEGPRVRQLLQKYGNLLPWTFRMSCYVGSFCPQVWTAKEKMKNLLRISK